jgi:hypothetical protein
MKAMFLAASLLLAGCGSEDSGGTQDTGPEDGPPEISVEPESLVFPAQAVGTSKSQQITVRNLGKTPLDIQGVTVGAPFSTTFTNHLTLPAGGAGIVTVVFAPSSLGHYEETLTIASDDPNRPSWDVPCVGDTITDADKDGFDAGFGVGEDCDDDNPNINPAADEVWYNGIDNNCTCDNEHCSDYDQDLDGWDHSYWNSTVASNGGDCNDSNASVHPEAADEWYDGYDTNCDGQNDNDQDLDGYSSSEHTSAGTDCDDTDPEINVDGTESYNGKDDECNGKTDYEILTTAAPNAILGHAAGDLFGRGLTSGNLDSGFESELLAGAPGYGTTGALAVFVGGSVPASGDFSTVADYFLEGASQDELGNEIAYLEDFGDGGAHVAVGATNYASDKGYAAVLLGDEIVAGSSLTDSTVLRIEGTTSGAFVGQALANDLDLDGDGYDELFGSMKSGTAISLWLFAGDTTLTGTYTTTDADARFAVTGTDSTMLQSFPTGGHDFDGDGYEDFLFCNDDPSVAGSGEVWMLWGDSTPYSNTSEESIADAGTTIATGSTGSSVGFICGTAGDWDDDGNAELWIYDYDNTDFYLLAGDASLRDGAVDVASTYLALYPFDSFTNDPVQLRDLGDVDDTTGREMAVALSSEKPVTVTVPGQVYVLGRELGFGLLGDYVENRAQAQLWGDKLGADANFGESVSARPADVTGLGGSYRTDLLVADPGYDGDMGAVYLYDNYNE